MPEIIKAKTAGFCMGVDLALRKLDRVVEENENRQIYTLGPIIHNPQVLEDYAEKGVKIASGPEEIPKQSKVVIRAHGVPKTLQEELEANDIQIVDATCPKVKKAQLLIQEQSKKGKLMLFGEARHPEVAGLLSYSDGKALVFENHFELDEVKFFPEEEYFLAAQTTQDRQEFNQIVSSLRKRLGKDFPVFDTICDTTRQRQEEAMQLADDVDWVVVVGGYSSGNTRRLAQVVRSRGVDCMHVEKASELVLKQLKGAERIGLTAGASTPRYIIKEVEQRLREI